MSPRHNSPAPTPSELAVLRFLWREGPSTVRAVHEELSRRSGIAYTTTLKTMQTMTEKGLLRRDESRRSHVYAARSTRESTQRRLLRTFMDQVFAGSRPELLLRALRDRPVDEKELEELRRILREIEEAGP